MANDVGINLGLLLACFGSTIWIWSVIKRCHAETRKMCEDAFAMGREYERNHGADVRPMRSQ